MQLVKRNVLPGANIVKDLNSGLAAHIEDFVDTPLLTESWYGLRRSTKKRVIFRMLKYILNKTQEYDSSLPDQVITTLTSTKPIRPSDPAPRPPISLYVGEQNPNSKSGHGMIHILSRHVEYFYPRFTPKGDLFPIGKTIKGKNTLIEVSHLIDGMRQVYQSGNYIENNQTAVNIYQGLVKFPGYTPIPCHLVVDNVNQRVISFFYLGGTVSIQSTIAEELATAFGSKKIADQFITKYGGTGGVPDNLKAILISWYGAQRYGELVDETKPEEVVDADFRTLLENIPNSKAEKVFQERNNAGEFLQKIKKTASTNHELIKELNSGELKRNINKFIDNPVHIDAWKLAFGFPSLRVKIKILERLDKNFGGVLGDIKNVNREFIESNSNHLDLGGHNRYAGALKMTLEDVDYDGKLIQNLLEGDMRAYLPKIPSVCIDRVTIESAPFADNILAQVKRVTKSKGKIELEHPNGVISDYKAIAKKLESKIISMKRRTEKFEGYELEIIRVTLEKY